MIVIRDSADGTYVQQFASFDAWLAEIYEEDDENSRIPSFFMEFKPLRSNPPDDQMFLNGPIYAGKDMHVQFIQNEIPRTIIIVEQRIVRSVRLE